MSAEPSPWDWLVAHRGYPDAWPENSLSGLRAAAEAGARHVEFDVQLSSDGVPMVVHDEDLSRIGGGHRRVTRLTAAQLLECPNGEPRRFGERFADERLPTLASVLALLAEWPSITLYVELKRASMRRFGRPALIDPVLKAIATVPNPCVVISFDATALEMARSRGAQRIGWAFKPWTDRARVEAARLRPNFLFVRRDRVPAGEAPFWPGPWQWVVYDVVTLAQARALRARGADLIETDGLPEMAAAWDAERGALHE